MNKSINLIFAALTSLFLFSCNSRQNVDGGPCTYQTTNYPATIIHIIPIDSVNNDIQFIADIDRYKDTLYYRIKLRSYISKEELKNKNIKPGDKWNYQHKQLTKGSCNPNIWELKQE